MVFEFTPDRLAMVCVCIAVVSEVGNSSEVNLMKKK